MAMLDIFNTDPAFNVTSLTDAVNNIPFAPGRCGLALDWSPRGVTATSIMIESIDGQLKLLNPTPRGGTGETKGKDRRNVRSLIVPHYQYDDAINADEVQGIRAFGTESDVQSVSALVAQRQNEAITMVLDPTLELQRLGAVKGVILNADGSTLYNLFTEFGVTQETEINFDLDNASPVGGVLREACANLVRKIADNLGGVTFTGVHAFCGNQFFDDMLRHPEVRASYLNTDMAQVLRQGYIAPNGNKIYGVFEFGGIVFENYRGKNGASDMVDTNKAHFLPVGTPGLFRTVFAPADYIETVNTLGLPRYSKQWMSPDGKRVNLETQMNALSYCTRPKTLMVARRT